MPGYSDIVNIAGLKTAQIDKPDFPIQPNEVSKPKSNTKVTTNSKPSVPKRGRKTKVDKLIDFIIQKKNNLTTQFSTTVRVQKKLLAFLRLVYAHLNICQIIELLILQCLEQNKHLLPDNYLEQIYPDDKNLFALTDKNTNNEK